MVPRALIKYIEAFGVRVTKDIRYSHMPNALFRYRSPFVSRVARGKVTWREKLRDHEYPTVDLIDGVIYWPETATDPYQLLHETAHLIGGVGSALWEDEGGPMMAFEYATVQWFARNDPKSLDRAIWLRWQEATGGYHLRDVEESYKAYFKPSLVKRGLFNDEGDPQPRSWRQHAFVKAHVEKALLWRDAGRRKPLGQVA